MVVWNRFSSFFFSYFAPFNAHAVVFHGNEFVCITLTWGNSQSYTYRFCVCHTKSSKTLSTSAETMFPM